MILLDASDTTGVLDYLSKGGVVALLIVILYGGYKQWWVFGGQYRELQERCTRLEGSRDEWMRLAMRRGQLEEILRPEADE